MSISCQTAKVSLFRPIILKDMKNFLTKIGLIKKSLELSDLVGEDASNFNPSQAMDYRKSGYKKTKPANETKPPARLARLIALFRRKISLRNYLTTIVFLSVSIASSVAGVSAYNMQYEKALGDTWAIMFLEGEKVGLDLATLILNTPYRTRLKRSRTFVNAVRKPDSIYQIENDELAQRIWGKDAPDFKATDLGSRKLDFSSAGNVFRLKDKIYVGKILGSSQAKKFITLKKSKAIYLGVWEVDLNYWLKAYGTDHYGEKTIYLTSNLGALLATLDPAINTKNLNGRALVQKFINQSLSQGNLHFTGADGEAYYGFFFEIPDTNVVVFRETSKSASLAVVKNNAKKFILILGAILVLLLLLLQLPLRSVIRPLSELVILARQVSQGNFKVAVTGTGFGEIVTLTTTFSEMAKNLVSRDNSINKLVVEQQDKIRMEREFAMAKSVQDNFLPKNPLPTESGLTMASIYVPAAQVAGDWFNFDYNPATGESIFVVADVSGHDLAASMFTAVIAGIFFDIRQCNQQRFPSMDFGSRLNAAILKYGQHKWHSTMLVVRFIRGEKELEVMNCGHTFPLLFSGKEGSKTKSIMISSTPVGMEEKFNGVIKKVPFNPGDTFLMYTDGITEKRQDSGKVYGVKRLIQAGDRLVHKPVRDLVNELKNDADNFSNNAPASDDVCILALRIVA